MKQTVPSFFGTMKLGASHLEPLTFFIDLIHFLTVQRGECQTETIVIALCYQEFVFWNLVYKKLEVHIQKQK